MPITLPTLLVAAPQAVTATASTDVFALTAHGYVAGNAVQFSALTGGAGVTAGTTYYVIASGLTANAFKVSATSGGSTIDVTTDMTVGTVTRVLHWADVKTIFAGEDLGHIAKYVQNNTSALLADTTIIDRSALATFYRWRNLPA